MKKALVFITFLFVFCCSAFSSAAVSAIEGIYDGILAAVASSITVPRVALQGVTVVRDGSIIPVRISFVRSDVSGYSDSLQFFSNGAGNSILSAISSEEYLSAISGFAVHLFLMILSGMMTGVNLMVFFHSLSLSPESLLMAE